ncbi:MAG: phage holin family protein [Oscillospiraceae bacterium]|nr:phage holin family protein [Oscillospiraceae bacterium]
MEQNNDLLLQVKVAAAAACGTFTALFGWMGWLVLGWALCMAADFITGCAAAGKNREWRSETAREGLWHKLGMIVAVAAAAGTDWVLGMVINNLPGMALPFTYSVLICPVVLVWYIVTELGSIAENAGRLGAPVPAFLTRILAQLQKTAEEMLEEERGDDKYDKRDK